MSVPPAFASLSEYAQCNLGSTAMAESISYHDMDVAVRQHVKWLHSSQQRGSRLVVRDHALRSDMFPPVSVGGHTGMHQLDACDLSGCVFDDQAFDYFVFQKADLTGAVFRRCTFTRCAFIEAILQSCQFVHCSFHESDFTGSLIDRCRIESCTIGMNVRASRMRGAHVTCSDIQAHKDGGTLEALKVEISEASISRFVLSAANLEQGSYTMCTFDACNIRNARLFNASFVLCDWRDAQCVGVQGGSSGGGHVSFVDSRMRDTMLQEAQLEGANLEGTDLSGANLVGARLNRARVRGAILVGAKGLEGPDAALQDDLWGTEWAVIRAPRDKIGWTLIRSLGSMPLFSASAVTVAGIVVYGRCVMWYNRAAVTLNHEMEQFMPGVQQAPFVGLLGFPIELILLLIATALLAAAAVIYRIYCPELVRDYSETQWVRQMKGSRLEYVASAWKHRQWRYVCAVMYGAGGGYSIGYLLWNAIVVVVRAGRW